MIGRETTVAKSLRLASPVAFALGLAACGDATEVETPDDPQVAVEAADPPPPPATSTAEAQAVEVSDAGIMLGEPEQTSLVFGADQTVAQNALADAYGAPSTGSNEECGAGPIEYARVGGLQLNFQDGQFAGWSLDGPVGAASVVGPNGLRLGDGKTDVMRMGGYQPFEESTLGDEFSISGGGQNVVSGLFGEDGTVSTLWSGVVCNFR